jgi:hypothetical protein
MRPWIFLLLVLAALPAEARLYKWVDEQGNVHYTDRVPPEVTERERAELDARGMTINKTQAAKTPEEIAREKQLEELRAEQKRVEAEQRALDEVLLRTFRSEDDIVMARDGKVASVDTLIDVTRGTIAKQQERLTEMQRQAADMERQGKPVSPKQIEEMDALRDHIDDNYAAIVQNEQARQAIIDKHDRDLRRFRQLKTPEKAAQEAPQAKARVALLDTVVACKDAAECDRLWGKAEAYVRANATTLVRMTGKSILATAPPQDDAEYSLTLSRLPDRDGSGVRLFLDLQCRDTAQGREFCKGPRASKVRDGFRAAVTAP